MGVVRQERRIEPLQVKYFSFEYQPMGEIFFITANPTRHWVGVHDVGLPYVLCRETAEIDDF